MASQTIGEPISRARLEPDPVESMPLVRAFHQILIWPLQLAAADHPLAMKLLYFAVTTAAFAALTIYTVARSQRIAEFLDALTNERLPLRAKTMALLDIWRKKR
jgi:hypothetical protein